MPTENRFDPRTQPVSPWPPGSPGHSVRAQNRILHARTRPPAPSPAAGTTPPEHVRTRPRNGTSEPTGSGDRSHAGRDARSNPSDWRVRSSPGDQPCTCEPKRPLRTIGPERPAHTCEPDAPPCTFEPNRPARTFEPEGWPCTCAPDASGRTCEPKRPPCTHEPDGPGPSRRPRPAHPLEHGRATVHVRPEQRRCTDEPGEPARRPQPGHDAVASQHWSGPSMAVAGSTCRRRCPPASRARDRPARSPTRRILAVDFVVGAPGLEPGTR